ncbi:MAG: N-acetyltransferase [Coriobacteriales bacterium]|nr:N-acetyltransferase [Coriobacteriales bacterium]
MIRIRPYIASDEKQVLSWCDSEDTFYKWTAGTLGAYPITPDKFAKMSDMMRFTAIDGDDAVGFFTTRNPNGATDELRMGYVLVDPNRRSAGVGKAMLRLGLWFAFELYQATRVTLVVFEDNVSARACYAAIGFAQTGKRETYVIDGEERHCLELGVTRPA